MLLFRNDPDLGIRSRLEYLNSHNEELLQMGDFIDRTEKDTYFGKQDLQKIKIKDYIYIEEHYKKLVWYQTTLDLPKLIKDFLKVFDHFKKTTIPPSLIISQNSSRRRVKNLFFGCFFRKIKKPQESDTISYLTGVLEKVRKYLNDSVALSSKYGYVKTTLIGLNDLLSDFKNQLGTINIGIVPINMDTVPINRDITPETRTTIRQWLSEQTDTMFSHKVFSYVEEFLIEIIRLKVQLDGILLPRPVNSGGGNAHMKGGTVRQNSIIRTTLEVSEPQVQQVLIDYRDIDRITDIMFSHVKQTVPYQLLQDDDDMVDEFIYNAYERYNLSFPDQKLNAMLTHINEYIELMSNVRDNEQLAQLIQMPYTNFTNFIHLYTPSTQTLPKMIPEQLTYRKTHNAPRGRKRGKGGPIRSKSAPARARAAAIEPYATTKTWIDKRKVKGGNKKSRKIRKKRTRKYKRNNNKRKQKKTRKSKS